MTNLIPLPPESDAPEPAPKKLSRKKRKEAAEQAAHDMKCMECSPEVLKQISTMGLHFDDVGPGDVARGVLLITYAEAERALADNAKQMEIIDNLDVLTEDDKDRRVLLARVRLEYTNLKVKIAEGMLRSKREVVKETTHAKLVQSFPANAPIPPMVLTESVIVKESESA